MSSWNEDELARIGAADEVVISPRLRDGTLGRATPIWVVPEGDDLYVRSWRGAQGGWFRRVLASHEGHIAPAASSTTSRLSRLGMRSMTPSTTATGGNTGATAAATWRR